MGLDAVDDVDDAVEATKAFLLPFDWGVWLRLGVISFFLGGIGGNVPRGDFGGGDLPVGGPPGGGPGTGGGLPSMPEVSGVLIAAIVAVVLVLVTIGIVFGVIGAVMEFALIESLRTEEVHVRRYFRQQFGRGLRLFGFRIGLGILALVVLVALLGALFVGMGGPEAFSDIGTILIFVLATLPILFVVGVLFVLINGFTTTFVVPVMMQTDRSVLGGWRRFWRTLRAEWVEYLVYAGLVFVLHLLTGIAIAIVMGIVALVLVIPLAIVGVFGLFAAGGVSPVALLVLGILAILFFLLFLGLGALVRVPVITFFRYYALLLLGDTDDDLDLIPDRRAEIRSDSSGDAVGKGPGKEAGKGPGEGPETEAASEAEGAAGTSE